MPSVDEALKLQQQYGLAQVLVVVLVIFFLGIVSFMLRWVVKTNKDMIEANHKEKMALSDLLNNGMKSVADALIHNTTLFAQLTQSIKEGFDKVGKADDFHRADLKEILVAVKDNDCKATGK